MEPYETASFAQKNLHTEISDVEKTPIAKIRRRTPPPIAILDSIYNISRHTLGIAAERSSGLMNFLDMDGAAYGYLAWRRTEARAFVPHSFSLDTVIEGTDLQFPRATETYAPVVGRGLGAVRVHPFNSNKIDDWVGKVRTMLSERGVDLIVSQDPNVEVSAVERLVKDALAVGGDLAAPAKCSSLSDWFQTAEICGPFFVGIGRREKPKKMSVRNRAWPETDRVDPLSLWIECRI